MLAKEDVQGKNILIPRAQEAREVLPEMLRERGAKVDVAPVYQTIAESEGGEAIRAALASREIDLVTFTSSSTVKNLVKMIGDVALLKGVKTAAIGPVTADTMCALGLSPDIVAETYTIDGFVDAIVKKIHT